MKTVKKRGFTISQVFKFSAEAERKQALQLIIDRYLKGQLNK